MVNELDENIYLVNAPAGSGKTTWIRKEVEKHLLNNENDNVLCITYTNRAAEELGRDIDSKRVFFGTIHSFISSYIGSFFEHNAIIDLYWDIYKDKILQRINNEEKKDSIAESNDRYIEKYGKLDLETVRANITKISYGEAPYTSLYRAALGHDDLISFTRIAVERYPIIQKKIRDKYQLVFIDEYQDTAADVLNLFYSSMNGKGSTGKLYLLGDKMQQIYKTYDGSFEDVFKRLNRTTKLDTNYRTTPHIVSILNALYNDESFSQHPYIKNNDESMLFKPCIYFVDNRETFINDFTKQYNDTLVLYLTNKDRFYGIGAGNLFDAYNSMDKYRFGGKYSVVDVLTKEEVRSEDILMNVIFSLIEICYYYSENKYGDIFKIARKKEKSLNRKAFTIKVHENKKTLHDILELLTKICFETECTINSFLQKCNNSGLLAEEYYERLMEDENYNASLEVQLSEVISLKDYLDNPNISTQHGVKGESHDTVLFVAENNTRTPVVNISKFFEMWSSINVTLESFDEFYYAYINLINSIEEECSMKISKIKADDYKENEAFIAKKINGFSQLYHTNDYYVALLKDKFDDYYIKQNMSKATACLKENLVYGVLSAYRLFYVGCSRARKNLAIVIQNSDVSGFKDKIINRFESIGFKVEDIYVEN